MARAAWRCCAARHGVEGVRAEVNGVPEDIRAKAVVLASGGFEANREWRARYLGPGWDMAKVRGTRFNTGDGIRMALDIGAQPYGQWSGCHSCAWERNAGDFGSVETRHNGFRHSYLYGIVVNADGKRFLDEGADFRNFTYAKYGRVILQQPGGYAWQVFDAQAKPLMRDEYKLRGATKVTADTLEDLATRMQDVDKAQFLKTVARVQCGDHARRAVQSQRQGRARTVGLESTRRTGRRPSRQPPFEAYSVGCGITFTFGGVKIDNTGRVLDIEDAPLPGLYAAGEMVGGIFYFNYPGRDRADVIGGVRPIGGAERGGTREGLSRYDVIPGAPNAIRDPWPAVPSHPYYDELDRRFAASGMRRELTTVRRRSSSSHRSPRAAST